METILVTGGAGFIGSHVCDRLLKDKKRVICIDNLNPYYSPQRKIKNIKHNFNNPNFKFIVLDITKKDQLEQVFQNNKIDKIIHLAARAGVRPSIEKPLWYKETNISGTVNLLELAKKYKIKNFVFGSSSSVYGKNKKVPFSETDNVDYPLSPYAASKKACELFCYTYSYLTDLNIACLRFFTVYGPRGRPDMAPYLFTKWIFEGKPIKRFGNGKTKRDYTYVSDIVDGVVSALNKNFKFEIINLGNSNTVELNYFITVIEKLVGKRAKIKQYPPQKGDVPLTYADINKARNLLGYDPKISIEEGMRKFVEWYRIEVL
ncbi:MAG: SDR family NAD(P)-dependent oxidoreductase [Promethearchaeota archaeon]